MRKRVLLIGLGLIGGSLALSIKKEHPECEIIGFDVDKEAVKLALSLQIIDRISIRYESDASNVDLIILATPVVSSIEVLSKLESISLKQNCLITDVGSTKRTIVEKGKQLTKDDVFFIGGHPMAGSHKTGVAASNVRLFENAFYIITPSEGTPSSKVIQLQNWLRGTKARFIELNPDDHDKFTGMVSHLPHVVAAALVRQTGEMGKAYPVVSQLAAGGFRDITRIASASPTMWRDILLQNKDILLSMLKEWDSAMKQVVEMLEEEDGEEIFRFFSEAKQLRDQLPVGQKGALMPFNDLYVDVPDHPGVISDVTSILAEERISITNIQIIEAREDIMGVLRLTFRSKEDLNTAKKVLSNHMYETYDMP
ncbi:prephenate dehydrogenase [Evansella cellulosilytica]|uniref:Prephenate dehydrogenase n=1 Tax=Evansella cellulosilytica (strain ATCC 21833 / DSM 2522 / FERM P-1141 / JCM 9156 / N-4) TaxID=649639 RepID=E6TZH0_EVAC2|nr:prephenate dehydrogenase [Evansella cellulosilytica]ADU30144.1 Prephenate dehydrogenase [Evansella cellulosilytica DSM 2522]